VLRRPREPHRQDSVSIALPDQKKRMAPRVSAGVVLLTSRRSLLMISTGQGRHHPIVPSRLSCVTQLDMRNDTESLAHGLTSIDFLEDPDDSTNQQLPKAQHGRTRTTGQSCRAPADKTDWFSDESLIKQSTL
jgi:hypothetical protein